MKTLKLLWIPTLCLLYWVFFSYSITFAREQSSVDYKEWSELSEEEKEGLRSRWTTEKVEEVLRALKEGNDLPEFINRLHLSENDLQTIEDLIAVAVLKREEAPTNTYDLRGISLSNQNLQNVNLLFLHLEGANLRGANLQEAHLSGAKLQGADLFGARFGWTYLWLTNLGEAKNIRYIVWDSRLFKITERILGNLKSERVPDQLISKLESIQNKEFIGEEGFLAAIRGKIDYQLTDKYKSLILKRAGDTSQSRYSIGEEKEMKFQEDFKKATITYRDLKSFYKKELLEDVAKEFHYRENEVITKGSPLLLQIFRLLFLKWTYGYGSRPFWLLPYSVSVIVIFGFIFALLTIPRGTKSGIYIVRAESDKGEERLNTLSTPESDSYVLKSESKKNEDLLTFRKGLLFLDCFYFSLLSFTTFGYGALDPRQLLEFFRFEPVEFKAVGWARILCWP